MPLRLVMLGTGEFARPAFRGLLDSPHPVVGLVTQPDRTGRGHHQHVNPLKELAGERNVPVFQPEKASSPESLDRLRGFAADLFVTAAYGQILSQALLDIPRLGAINLHASLLPKYRGAAPIQYALLRGETETGITIFQIEPALDAGPILGTVRTPIAPDETAGTLHDRLAGLAVPLLRHVLDELEAGTARPVPQDHSQATLAPRLKKSDGEVPWQLPARLVCAHIRAMQPWPKPFTTLRSDGGRTLRLLVLEARGVEDPVDGPPGTPAVRDRHRLLVATGTGAVELLRIQPDGRRPMAPAEFLNGHPLYPGDRFDCPDHLL